MKDNKDNISSRWYRDPRVEQLLTNLGLTFEIRKDIPLSSLRLEESKNANARYNDQTFADNVTLYTSYMKDGHRFPMPVVTADLMIPGGCNRLEAAMAAGIETVDAYCIIDSTPDNLEEFKRRDNTQHGRALTEDERIAWIVTRHRTAKIPLYNLNRDYFGDNKRTLDKVKAAVCAAETADSLGAIGIDPTKIEKTARAALYQVRAQPKILRDLAEIIIEFNPPVAELEQIVTEVRDPSNKSDDLLKTYRSERVKKRDTGSMSSATNFARHLNALTNFLETGNGGQPFLNIGQIGFRDGQQEKQVKDLMSSLSNRLQMFAHAQHTHKSLKKRAR